MKIPNDIYIPEKYIVTENHSFYKELKYIIRQDYLISKQIFEENQNKFNPIKILVAFISEKTVCLNPNLIDINNLNSYEIQRQIQIGNPNLAKIDRAFSTVSAIPEYEQLCSLAEKQFIDWWEEKICPKIILKYGKLNLANSKCQFARQLRNAFAHSKINIDKNLKCEIKPVWQYLNLKEFNGEKVFDLMSLGDLINFWIEFEETELN
ncbi:hypothetical protein [Flavobacterium faecale]|nr:hypothetical protein [Flavobacterium faecale]